MPTYEYQCKKCQHRYEVFQRISEKPKTTCPDCKGPLKRLISKGAGFIFKGSGFYATDYRSKEYKQKAKQENNATTCPSSGNSEQCKNCPKNE